METARDCAGALLRPLTFMGSQTKKVLFTPLMHPARPFRVSNHDRSSRRGVMASSLQELLSKTLDALVVPSQLVTLVLEEDGTVVDTEEFFQTLGDNTHLMVLEQGQKWTPAGSHTPARWPPQRRGIAKVTFDLYKLSPKDVIGCLNVKATMYEMYSVSYDIHCTGFKAMLRSLNLSAHEEPPPRTLDSHLPGQCTTGDYPCRETAITAKGAGARLESMWDRNAAIRNADSVILWEPLS
uniref:Lipid transferase CIDEA n=1 Tax=Capra hircus TaxID=9925 RepID=A0A8C2P922_CAPHI